MQTIDWLHGKTQKTAPLKRWKSAGAAYKTPSTLKKGLFSPQELENYLMTHRAFDDPGVKECSEKGKS